MAPFGAVVLFLVAAATTAAFTWQDGLATFGDDSASYLTLAHWLAGSAGSPIVAEWAPYHTNFPPLFPLVLAWSGSLRDLHIAFGLVAVFGAAGTVLFYRFAATQVGERAALASTALFLLAPTAWISLKGVLSESLFLALCMASLLLQATRLATRRAGSLEWLAFGLLLACAALTRAVGIVLVVAYAAGLLWRLAIEHEKPAARELLPVLPVIVLLGLWYGLRPQPPVDSYRIAASWVIGSWLQSPADTLVGASKVFIDGWIRSFMADHDVPPVTRAVYSVLGVVAIGGALLRARRGHLDGRFAVLYLAVVFAWPFSADTTRRLLYPVIPLAILCIVDVVRTVLDGARWSGRRRALAATATAALPVLLSVPAVAMIVQRSLDTRPVIEGCPQRHRDISDYFGTVSLEEAEKLAVLEVTVLCGLQTLERVTPPASTILWTRPEYVALLGHRRAQAYYKRWSAAELADHLARASVPYVVVTQIDKTDLEGRAGPASALESIETEPVFTLSDGIFALYRPTRRAGERPSATGLRRY